MKSPENDLFAFEWERDEDGYELLGLPRGRAAIVLNGFGNASIRRKGGVLKTYWPRAVPALHRTFAALPDDVHKLLEFVNAYGFLGVDGKKGAQQEQVDQLFRCRDELRDSLAAVDEYIKLEHELHRVGKEMQQNYKRPHVDPGEARQIAAGFFNQWAVNYTDQLRAELVPAQDRHGRASVVLRVRPQTLLASMWLAAAEEIAGEVRYRLCAVCKKPIAIGEGGGRRDKQTCSAKCRKRLSDLNKAAAKLNHASPRRKAKRDRAKPPKHK